MDNHAQKPSRWTKPAGKLLRLVPTPPPVFYQQANKTLVAVYKYLGIAVLSVLAFWTLCYLSATIFFLLSNRWITPFVASPGQERVMKDYLLASQNLRLLHDLQDKRNNAAAELHQQKETARIKRNEFNLGVNSLVDQERTNQVEQGLVNPNISEPTDFEKWRNNIRTEFERRLITEAQMRKLMLEVDRQQMRFERKSLYSTPLFVRSVAQRYFKTKNRAELLSALEKKHFTRGTANVVRMLMETQLAIARAETQIGVQEKSIQHLDGQITLYKGVVKSMANSPFVEAANAPVAMAFLPHVNRTHLADAAPVFACRFYFVGCSQVGTVRSHHSDEVSGNHPFFNYAMRGSYLELEASPATIAEKPMLFLGRPPFLW